MAENSNIAKSLTMVETTVEPDPNANIIINDNGKVRQASVDNLLENSDINTSIITVKETTEKIYDIVSADAVFGFIEHMDILSPSQRIEYIGANAAYTPVSITKGGGYSLNSWADFPWLKSNKPYMVKADGTPDYRLNENDYTKKEDGTDSDVSNTSYNGGAFAWAMKIYKHERMVGSDRIVKFSFEARDGYEPVGFVDPDNNELEGVWIPMFYGSIIDSKMKCISGTQPCYNNTTAAEKTAIDNFGARAKFFGGAIVQTLIDLMIMFAKTTDLQGAYGNGNMNGYDASLAPTNGVKHNAVVGGGQFYGTSDGKSLNKIFHSIVLGSYQQWMRDPYTICVNGKLKVSKNYAYDLTGASYSDTGIEYDEVNDTSWKYPHRFQTVPEFGAIGVYPFKGSTSTGGCDGLIVNKNIVAVALRFGSCNYGLSVGPRALILSGAATSSDWTVSGAVLLLPPVGIAA